MDFLELNNFYLTEFDKNCITSKDFEWFVVSNIHVS